MSKNDILDKLDNHYKIDNNGLEKVFGRSVFHYALEIERIQIFPVDIFLMFKGDTVRIKRVINKF